MTETATQELRLPWGTTPEGEFTRKGTILASAMGTLAVFVTLPLGVTGIVLSCIGLDRIRRHDPSARKLLVWSWVLFVPGTVIGVPLVLAFLGNVLLSIFG
jgi:hypothetical protein